MFEKEAEEYAGNREVCDLLDAISEDLQNYDYGTVAHYNIDPLVEECFKDGAEFGYNKTLKETWHYPSKGEYPEKEKKILLYTKTLGLIFGEFCKGYNNLWTSNRCDFTTEEIIAWIEKEKILPKGE